MSLLNLSKAQWPALSTLLDAVLELPPAERERFIDALDGAQAALKAPLRQLLAQQRGVETDEFLATLPRLSALRRDGDSAHAPAPGLAVGPYRLLRELGRGGMGSVWLAERADGALQRSVALKLPRLSWEPGTSRRIARERDILAALEHPHIARLYDAGVDAHGRPYLAMEYVDGSTIDDWCRAQRLDLHARVALLLQVAEAVGYAHRRLVVHRDLKPGNILVTADRQGGQVRLLDFGIARLLAADGGALDLTQAAQPLTLNYASPEQLEGRTLSTATDIYSLGVIAHELLTGVRPFDHLGERGAARLPALLAAEVGRPSARLPGAAAAAERRSTPAALQKQLAGDLDAILLRALARRPEDRYASVDAFAADLARWRDGQPVSVRAPSRLYLLGKFVRRHRLAVASGSVAVLALAATATVAVVLGLQAREQSQRAQASRDFLLGLFERADPDLRGGRDATARELLEPAVQDVARLPATQQREVLQTIATLWLHFGDVDKARATQAQVSARLEAVGGEPLARSRVEEARLATVLQDADEIERLLASAEQALAPARWPLGLQAQAQEQRGWLAVYRQDFARAVEHFERARALARRADDPARELLSLHGLAHAQRQLARYDVLEQTLAAIAAGLADLPAAAEPNRFLLLMSLADNALWLGRYADGWRWAQQLVAEADRRFGTDAARQLPQRALWLRYCLHLDRGDEAATWLRAHPLQPEDRHGVTLSAAQLAEWHGLRGRAFAAAGDRTAALAALDEADAAVAAMPASAQPLWRSGLKVQRAMALVSLNDDRAALDLIDRLGDAASLPRNQRLGLHWSAAVALARLGRRQEADAHWARAEDSLPALGARMHPQRGLIALNRLLSAPSDGATDRAAQLDAARQLIATGYGPDSLAAQRAAELQWGRGADPARRGDPESAAARRAARGVPGDLVTLK